VSQRPLDHLDAMTGRAVDLAVGAHHRRRLRRTGRLEQLDPPTDGSLWAAADPAPRGGNQLEVLIDGESALPRIAEALEGARSHVHIAGWHITPDFGLTRDQRASRLRDLLAELAERIEVRVLLWGGSPLPLFTPDRAAVRAAREELIRDSRVRCALDMHERPMHCHHEKLVIVDDEVAFVGGIDITSLGGDRFDSSDHPMSGRLGWHDAATRLSGPAVGDVTAHFAMRWHETTGERLAERPPMGATGAATVQIVRTLPEKVYGAQDRGDFRILEAYTRALRSAREFIYLESQFLWSAQIVELLSGKLREPPTERFRVVVLLPAKPNNGADDTRGKLAELVRADDHSGRFLAATISARTGRLSGPLYVHAKVGIVDDRWLTAGSANLNEHSLFNDTEVNVVLCDEQRARDARLRLWSEHLERDAGDIDGDPASVIDELWRPLAMQNAEHRRLHGWTPHRLVTLPHVSRRAGALRGPINGLLVDG
jgi:phosphatidylserine/phosphatidylglycerophosphate/cardiolipin synthase-like enzyme